MHLRKKSNGQEYGGKGNVEVNTGYVVCQALF